MLEDALAEQFVGVVGDTDGVAEAQLLQPGLFFHLAQGALLDGLFRFLLPFGEVPEFVTVDEQVFSFFVLYQAAGGGDFLEVGAEFRIIGITDGDALALEVNVPHYFRIFAELALAKIVFPAEFINEMRDSLGPARAERILAALAEEPAVSVRVNPYKLTLEALRANFGDLAGDAVAWAPEEGFYLKERPSFTLDPLFHAGAYYVQEASSMYVGGLFDQAVAALGRASGLRVLDLCAAPGGKTTQLLSHLDAASLLVANEVVPARATVLAENVARWGCANVAVTSSDPSAFTPLRNFFDLVVVDAPCSGEGMFRKDERAVAEWSPDNVRLCAARQRRILGDVWPALAPGGFLIYSTCTFNRFEDEENVEWICRELGATCQEMRHFYPGEDRGEGFFAALLRKDGPQNETGPKVTAVGPQNKTVPETTVVGPQNERTRVQTHSVARKQRFQSDSRTQNGCVIVEAHSVALLKQVSDSLVAVLPKLEKQLRVIASGIAVATRKGRDLVPEADFALAVNRMSLDGLPNRIPQAGPTDRMPLDGLSDRMLLDGLSYAIVEISSEDALKFLSKDPLVLPDAPRGYILLTHAGLGLGFVKNLGTRTNSLLPSSRRIRQRP